MSNWIENNPTKSIVIYSITLVAATFGVLYFILIENQENLHSTEKENLKTQIQTLNERIDLLQYDNGIYIEQNNKLKDWIKSNPNSFEFLEEKIEKLEKLVSEIDTTKSSLPELVKLKYYTQSNLLSIGQAFLDTETGASIGLNDMNVNRTASGIINIPGKENIEFKAAKPGTQWSFKQNGFKYSLILLELNYVGSKYRVAVKKE
ncbi:hypothetical protein [Winogradskyella sp. 3972H.M.0a.05]|uniref:hypothetical protein n=1 Tax=Winogradskyella sp. 3972H.M.0a.05 TaxID=2950277 RepID=UPI0033953E44